ncbi:MAG: AsmA-like C-terminal region-containing protein [Alphaproteobacteria bacterium]|nr:AsmA-like C-terminal region-containing protein [Alphaproteobacteria bacterium]
MTRRNPLILLELVAAAAAALSVLAGVAFFLLTMGPIRLDFLTPYIENALSPPGGPISVKIDVTKLTWDGWQRPVDVRAEGVRIVNPTGTELATLDQVSIGLSIPGLMRGLVAPTSLDIHRPTVRLTRARDGHFEFGLGDSGTAGEQPALQRLIGGLLSPPNPNEASGYLERVSISDAVLTLDDQMLEMSWKALDANVALLRGEGGISASFAVPFLVDGKPAALQGKVVYALAQDTIDLAVEFADIVPARFAAGSPALERLAALDMPIGGTVEARMRSSGEIERIVFDMNGRKGRLLLPELGAQGIEVAAAKVVGRAERDLSFYILENVYLDLGGPNISAAAVVSTISDQPEAKVNAIIRRLDVADLQRLWPATVRPELRQWLSDNVRSGRADETTVAVAGRLVGGGFEPDFQNLKLDTRFSNVTGTVGDSMQLEQASGVARFGKEQVELTLAGAELRWTKANLPPLSGIKARATLVPGRRADISISEAKFGGLALTETVFKVTGLDQVAPEVDGKAVVRGSVGRFVALMQKSELGGLGETGIDAATVKGEVAASTRFRFELGPKFSPDRIQRSAAAKIVDLAVPHGPMGLSISDGEMTLSYDARDIKMDGALKLNGAPVSVQLVHALAGKDRDQTYVHLVGTLNDEQRRAMGLGLEKVLTGVLDYDVDLTRSASGTTTADARFKLDRAKVRLAQIYWEKPQGVPGSVNMTLTTRKGRPVEVSEFQASSAGMKAEGRAWMKLGTSDIDRIEFDTLSFQATASASKGRTDVQAMFSRRPMGGWDVALLGEQLDLQPYIDDPDILLDFPMTVTTQLKRLRLSDRRNLEQVGLTAAYGGEYWDSIDLEALLPNKSEISVRYTPVGERRQLLIYASDAAAMLQMMTDAQFARDLRGGMLAIQAMREPMLPTTPIEGVIQMRDFTLRDTPIGDRILTSASGFGPFEVLTGEDLNFSKLEGKFKKTGDVIVLQDVLAMSRGLGMNAQGVFDMAAGQMDLSGFVSPFRGIGKLLDENPWIGAFLVDVDKQGLIAVPFEGKGSFGDPDFKVGKKPHPLPPGQVREFARFAAGKERDLSAENRMKPAGMSR